MPILSKVGNKFRSRHSIDGKDGGNSRKKREDHRRSWHVGKSCQSIPTTADDATAPTHRRRTWHFPRLSIHGDSTANANSGNGNGSSDNDHHGRFATGGARKTFKNGNVAIGTEETATRAPSPPDSTETEIISTLHPQQQQQSNTSNNSTNHTAIKGQTKHDGLFKRIKRKTGRLFHAVEEFVFPTCHLPHNNHHHYRSTNSAAVVRVRGGVLLRGCLTAEEHKAKVQETVEVAHKYRGEEGLRAAGFEYRRVTCCPGHSGEGVKAPDIIEEVISLEENGEYSASSNPKDEHQPTLAEGQDQATNLSLHQAPDCNAPNLLAVDASSEESTETAATIATATATTTGAQEIVEEETDKDATQQQHICHLCSSRLFHRESNTQIDASNRKLFIADGDMYEAIARMCQENAQERMERDYNLKWVTIATPHEEENGNRCSATTLPPLMKNEDEPVRALVNAEHPLLTAAAQNNANNNGNNNVPKERLRYFANRPILLIATGKGKVRAGIFSRQHLIVSGMESSTALPLIHEARLRGLNLAIIDPNVHGDALGMVTFEKSMAKLFRFWEERKESMDGHGDNNNEEQQDTINGREEVPFSNPDLYILSHSASGGQLARYLMDKSEFYLPHIRAIAFTDSTHNVQWARQKGKHDLVRLLESPACIYFRCGKEENCQAGDEAPRDTFWKHRFGSIDTRWAGTTEHSLTNWFARTRIWEHFDRFLKSDRTPRITTNEDIWHQYPTS